MKIRLVGAMVLSLAFVQVVTSGQGRGGGGGGSGTECVNPLLEWTFDSQPGDRITGDGGTYQGTSFFCGGKPDAHLNVQKTSGRQVFFDFSGLIDTRPDGTPTGDQREAWMGSVPQPLEEMGLNVRALGSVRTPGASIRTVMAGTFKGLDKKSYFLRMVPLNIAPDYVDLELDNPPDSPPDVNNWWMTSHVVAVFFAPPTCPPDHACTNPYGMWEVTGRHVRTQDTTVTPPVQVATIYKSTANPTRVGQFSLPFKVRVRALSPLP